MKYQANICIGRNSSDEFTITIQDEGSRVLVCKATMDAATFAHALTGLANQPVMAESGPLEHVGKVRVRESRTIACPLGYSATKGDLAAWLIANASEDGWFIDTYLGSQGSVTHTDGGGCRLRYSVYKFVPLPAAKLASP